MEDVFRQGQPLTAMPVISFLLQHNRLLPRLAVLQHCLQQDAYSRIELEMELQATLHQEGRFIWQLVGVLDT